jgi:DNA gyrase subunit A
VSLSPVFGREELFVLSEGGILIRTKVDQVSSYGRASQGVTVMRMGDADRVVQAIVLPAEEQVAQVAKAIEESADDAPGGAA